jgi:DNA-binding response OmpR family regulator
VQHPIEVPLKILIVDESETSFSEGMKAREHEVVKIRFLKEALEKLQESFDILALQLGLPFTACEALIRAARQKNPSVQIILLASQKAALAESAKQKIGADQLLLQPLTHFPI